MARCSSARERPCSIDDETHVPAQLYDRMLRQGMRAHRRNAHVLVSGEHGDTLKENMRKQKQPLAPKQQAAEKLQLPLPLRVPELPKKGEYNDTVAENAKANANVVEHLIDVLSGGARSEKRLDSVEGHEFDAWMSMVLAPINGVVQDVVTLANEIVLKSNESKEEPKTEHYWE